MPPQNATPDDRGRENACEIERFSLISCSSSRVGHFPFSPSSGVRTSEIQTRLSRFSQIALSLDQTLGGHLIQFRFNCRQGRNHAL